jgi:hypothetical protein
MLSHLLAEDQVQLLTRLPLQADQVVVVVQTLMQLVVQLPQVGKVMLVEIPQMPQILEVVAEAELVVLAVQ